MNQTRSNMRTVLRLMAAQCRHEPERERERDRDRESVYTVCLCVMVVVERQ